MLSVVLAILSVSATSSHKSCDCVLWLQLRGTQKEHEAKILLE